MTVVAISPRPYPPGRPDPAPRPTPTLTITLDLGGGALTPGLSRLVDLLDELAATGEGVLRHEPTPPRPGTARRWGDGRLPGPRAVPDPPEPAGLEPADAATVRILAGTRVVRHAGREIPLTRIEFDLLRFLAEHPRRVFTRLQLLTNVWGYEHAVARTVDVHVRRLRAKLGADNPLVTTVYGVGYRLADDARVVVDPDR
ncbi:winged helix-turn-helix domain-containing protein [Micromonospora sp. PLK6-60]|uniref:winged helix-turn-helix domain-containing protein n=1 Tax=Micromonospora sp. PLK6-60 TaxID=2873383 RepID=UPI001CA73EC0|nr:winged helix-turn-helix domain-containing protein [Micromonospora sp. PLK6-60]MBY8874637.1 winged helix-turn-helix domain-containing protein [Micromonospora sp. PLK6-60]